MSERVQRPDIPAMTQRDRAMGDQKLGNGAADRRRLLAWVAQLESDVRVACRAYRQVRQSVAIHDVDCQIEALDRQVQEASGLTHEHDRHEEAM